MKMRRMCAIACLLACLIAASGARAVGKSPVQLSWGRVVEGPAEVFRRPSTSKKVLARLGSGALVAVFETKRSGGGDWAKVSVVLPATLEVVTGWTDARRLEILPVSQFPADSELLKSLGGAYLEDFHAKYVQFARYLVGRANQEPLLVCYFGSVFLPQTRLQAFMMSGGKWVAGPYLEFHFSQMQTAVSESEVRDLVGDGNECLITHEPFSEALGNGGVNMVIRRIEAGGFKVLWQAPLELRSLSSYLPRQEVLKPPERNIGAPGTVTIATVDFQTSGRVTVPVWKGKIQFHALGREEPIDTVEVEKVCNWNGSEFTPLQQAAKPSNQR